MSVWRWLFVLAACKADPSPTSPSGSAAPPPPGASGAPKGATTPTALPALMPTIEGAKELRVMSGDRSHTAIWCIDAPDAIDQITSALRKAGWEDVRTRGQPPKIAIAGNKGEVRFSATTSSSDKCAGTYVVASVAQIGAIEIPPGGEPVR